MATVSADMLTNRPSITPTSSSKALSNSLSGITKQKPAAPVIPRVDVEPLYTALKEQIGDKWAEYKEIVCHFVLGTRNQEELSRALDPILQWDPAKEEAHNRLICAILLNATRDLPEPGIASFVSANDKPTNVSKPVTGDIAEQRLKTEVMQLPARDRHRVKTIQDEPYDGLARMAKDYQAARTIRGSDLVPASAGGFSKTNWDLEIMKRYKQPLFIEINEFPDTDSINSRMVPICYENGIGGGAAAGTADFMNTATETFVKELLANLFGRVRSNGDGYIKTAAYKRRLEKEEAMWLSGQGGIVRNAAGLLPAEVEAMDGRKPLGLRDLRLALRTGDSFLLHFPLTAAMIGTTLDDEASAEDEDEDEDPDNKKEVDINGVATQINGAQAPLVNGHSNEEMEVDGAVQETHWIGGAIVDKDMNGERDALSSLLDDCLILGS